MKPVPSSVESEKARYASEQAEIQRKAQELEHQRDEKSAEAEHLIHRHHAFANAVALLQVGIALGAIAALTRMKLAWVASVVAGAIGAAFFIRPFIG